MPSLSSETLERMRRENAEAAREAELRDFLETEGLRNPPRVYTETMDEKWWGDE